MKQFNPVKVLQKIYPVDWEEQIENIKYEGKWEEFLALKSAEELAQFLYTYMK